LRHQCSSSRFPIPSYSAIQSLGAQIKARRVDIIKTAQAKLKKTQRAAALAIKANEKQVAEEPTRTQSLTMTNLRRSTANQPSANNPATSTLKDLYVVDFSGERPKTYVLKEIRNLTLHILKNNIYIFSDAKLLVDRLVNQQNQDRQSKGNDQDKNYQPHTTNNEPFNQPEKQPTAELPELTELNSTSSTSPLDLPQPHRRNNSSAVNPEPTTRIASSSSLINVIPSNQTDDSHHTINSDQEDLVIADSENSAAANRPESTCFKPNSNDWRSSMKIWSRPSRPGPEVSHSLEFKRRYNTKELTKLGKAIQMAVFEHQAINGAKAHWIPQAQTAFTTHTQGLVIMGESTADYNFGIIISELEKLTAQDGPARLESLFDRWLPKLGKTPGNEKQLLNLRIFQSGRYYQHTTFSSALDNSEMSEPTLRIGNLSGDDLLPSLVKVIIIPLQSNKNLINIKY
jgi:hypothetical protein